MQQPMVNDIKNEITNGIEITDALKQVLISENGANQSV